MAKAKKVAGARAKAGATKRKSAEDLLVELEGLIGGALPADYRSFMATFDGTLPADRSFKVKRGYWDELSALWPLRGRSGTVAGGWGLLKKGEGHLLVIGDDGGGNWVCLAVQGAERGRVFFVDQDYSPGEQGRVVKLAESFEAFMAGLGEGSS